MVDEFDPVDLLNDNWVNDKSLGIDSIMNDDPQNKNIDGDLLDFHDSKLDHSHPHHQYQPSND